MKPLKMARPQRATSNVLNHQECATDQRRQLHAQHHDIAGSVTSSNAVLTCWRFRWIEVQPIPTNQVMAVGANCGLFRQRHRNGAVAFTNGG